VTFILGIDDLKHRLKGMGLVMISEGMIDEKVYTGTYSIPANNTFPLGSTILEKRKKNIEGETCELNCGSTGDVLGPVNDDCATLFNLFTTYPNQFRVGVGIGMSRFPSWFYSQNYGTRLTTARLGFGE